MDGRIGRRTGSLVPRITPTFLDLLLRRVMRSFLHYRRAIKLLVLPDSFTKNFFKIKKSGFSNMLPDTTVLLAVAFL